MKNALPTDVGASVRTRLLRLARERGEDFQLVLTRYANERLLFRLATSRHGSLFVLKGAALFTLWTGKPHRATRDLDLLGFGDPGEDHIREVFTEVLTLGVEDDGVRLDPSALEVEPIRESQEYGGIRVSTVARITTAKVRLQVDIGFGDAITPEPHMVELPPLLDGPAPRIRAYPRETVVAEKVEAMVQLGLVNSRMKDFYDLVVLAKTFDFEGEVLARAIRATFDRRGTPFPVVRPVALTPVFYGDATKVLQWAGFIRKSRAPEVGSLPEAIADVTAFIEPPLVAARTQKRFVAWWRAGGPWR